MKLSKSLLVASGLLISVNANANVNNVVSKIDSVIVYTDQADVSRIAFVDLPVGKSVIVFKQMPYSMIKDSVRISGIGNSAFDIGSVEIKEVFLTDEQRAKNDELQNKLMALKDKKSLIQSQIEATNASMNFIKNIQLGKNDLSLNQNSWQAAWQNVKNGMNTLGKENVNLNIQLRKIDDEIKTLEKQINSSNANNKRTFDINVNVETKALTKANINLKYRVRGVFWHPEYEAKLDSATQSVQIEQYGVISQKSGEDWKNVSLELSTGRPTQTTRPPELYPSYVDVQDQVDMADNSVQMPLRKKMMVKTRALNSVAMNEEMDMVAAAPAPMLYAANTVKATEESNDYTQSFKIPGLNNVQADGSEKKLNINAIKTSAELSIETVPSLDSAAYVLAELTFNGNTNNLPGKMSLYRDGAYIGNTYVNMMLPGEKTKVYFGQDDSIKVQYKVLGEKKHDAGMIAKLNQNESSAQTKVQNMHKKPIKLVVYERIPVSKNDSVEVKVVKTKTTPDYISEQGVIKWEYTLQPNEAKTYDFDYIISWPKDKMLIK
ncbi:MAG: mucoidy inhibitor MuiA family protein [Alphaproteobacteria bacterium]|nr:mucoidy inhibitor MuiA family protein [Alphaproteobacteria bacterium]